MEETNENSELQTNTEYAQLEFPAYRNFSGTNLTLF